MVVLVQLLVVLARTPRPGPGRLDEQPVPLAHEDRRLAADVDVPRRWRRVLVLRQVAVVLAGLLDPGVAAHGARLAALEAVRLPRAALHSPIRS